MPESGTHEVETNYEYTKGNINTFLDDDVEDPGIPPQSENGMDRAVFDDNERFMEWDDPHTETYKIEFPAIQKVEEVSPGGWMPAVIQLNTTDVRPKLIAPARPRKRLSLRVRTASMVVSYGPTEQTANVNNGPTRVSTDGMFTLYTSGEVYASCTTASGLVEVIEEF